MAAHNIRIPGVEVHEALGKGAFGAVYRGRHATLDVDVAVKLVDASTAQPSGLEYALQEARFMARLDHPNLLRIFDAGWLEDSFYLVLEMMDGGSCQNMHGLRSKQAEAIANQLLSGLQALHDARLLHRDIKPANCLIRTGDERVKLADLGIAVEWATRSNEVHDTAGTLPFMAPELFERPARFSRRSDLYALGMTLACLCLDEDPFPRGSRTELLGWIMSGPRPPVSDLRPDLPAPLLRLIEATIDPDVDARPADAAQAIASLATTVTLPLAPTEPMEDAPARRIGPWVIGTEVAEWSNWRVYAASYAETGAPARLMHLRRKGPLSSTTDLVLGAAERSSRLQHPGIVGLLDWGTEEGRAYVVTSPHGLSLAELVKSGGPCPEPVAIDFLISVAAAVEYLHAQELVYQILVPGSVVVRADARSAQLAWPVYCVPSGTPARESADERLSLVMEGHHRGDRGIERPEELRVRRLGASNRILVPLFAPPEVAYQESETIEPSVDLYGLGVLLYYLLVGDEDYQPSPTRTHRAVRAMLPNVTARTARLIADLLSPDPGARPGAATVGIELVEIAGHLGAP